MSYDANEDRYEEEPVARRRRGSGGDLTADDKQWGMFCHLSSLAGFVVPGGNIIGPVVCWMMKKEESRFVDYHGKESVNFQISMLIYILICFATSWHRLDTCGGHLRPRHADHRGPEGARRRAL